MDKEKIKGIIVAQIGCKTEELVDTANFVNDLGVDSLDTVELIMALEDELDIEIPDEDVEKFDTVGALMTYLEKEKKC